MWKVKFFSPFSASDYLLCFLCGLLYFQIYYQVLMQAAFVIRMTLVDTEALLINGQLSSKHVWFVLCRDPMALTHTLMNYVSGRNGFEYRNVFWYYPYEFNLVFCLLLLLQRMCS